LLELGVDEHPARASVMRRVGRALCEMVPDADVVLGAGSVLVMRTESGALDEIGEAGRSALERALGEARTPLTGAIQHDIRVVYDGADLADLADAAALEVPEIIERHAGRPYVVEVVGFLPGFGYLGPLDPALVQPRRQSPRKRVAASSVGVAGGFTGIYPFASPGGWHLLGRAVDPCLFDVHREPPGRFRVGDEVRFIPARSDEAPESLRRTDVAAGRDGPDARSASPALEIVRAPPGATIQDAGRAGQMGRGLPPSGPLDALTFARANRAVGNHVGAAAIEIPLNRMVVRALRRLTISLDGDAPIVLGPGDELDVAPTECAVRYLAVEGGVDVPVVLGSRSTLLVAGFGGCEGRMLKKGDRLAVNEDAAAGGAAQGVAASPPPDDATAGALDADGVTVLTALRGPSSLAFAPEAWHILETKTFLVSHLGNRVGVRLEGRIPRVGGDAGLPSPMVRGAVQVSTDGTPIVLGPDHAVTGGYPVIAVLTPMSMARLAQLRPGRAVRFEVSS